MLTRFTSYLSLLFAVTLLSLLSACGGGSSSSSTTTTTTPITPPPTAAAISLGASSTSVAADNSTTTTITAIVTDASNAAVVGVPVTFSADTGFLTASSVTSDSTGKATVTFSSGVANATTRTATITATASGKSTQIPISITGTAVTVASGASSLVVGGATTTLSVVVKSASGVALSGQTVTLTAAGTGSVTLSPTTGTTDSSGTFTSTVTATAPGTVTVTAVVDGETRTFVYTTSGASVAFQITAPSTDPSAAAINTATTVTVSVPSSVTKVVFVATLGTWDATGSSSVTKNVSGGMVSATLTSSLSGVSNVEVYDASNLATNASRSISFTAPSTAAAHVTVQATPSVVAPNKGGTAGIANIVATVTDASGNPVGGAAVAFSIVNPTGGGETVVPAVSLTSSIATSTLTLGQTQATFTAGSLPSSANGVQVKASVINTSLSSTASIVIGGTAGSVAIGRATTATSDPTNTIYTLPMSVLVADSNGNPVANTVVSLSAWPIAFNANGTSCAPSIANDYFNEDVNENLVLDSGEDGVRRHYPGGAVATGGTLDGKLTPPNSAAGTLPATVTTNASGVATFNLTYTKSNALWIIDRIRAKTIVQGTETNGEITFRLPALISDIGPPCLLPDSPYLF